jgi:hypothetical protein
MAFGSSATEAPTRSSPSSSQQRPTSPWQNEAATQGLRQYARRICGTGLSPLHHADERELQRPSKIVPATGGGTAAAGSRSVFARCSTLPSKGRPKRETSGDGHYGGAGTKLHERVERKMKKFLSAALVALLLEIAVARPAAARCVADEWTNEREDRPNWKCWDAGAGSTRQTSFA